MHLKSNVMRIYIKHKYGGWRLINVEKWSVAESRSTDHCLANSDEMILKVVARLEKLDKIEKKKMDTIRE